MHTEANFKSNVTASIIYLSNECLPIYTNVETSFTFFTAMKNGERKKNRNKGSNTKDAKQREDRRGHFECPFSLEMP